MLVRIKSYLAMYKPFHIAKLKEIEELILISHKVISAIQKIRIGFGEMDIAAGSLEQVFRQYKVPGKRKEEMAI